MPLMLAAGVATVGGASGDPLVEERERESARRRRSGGGRRRGGWRVCSRVCGWSMSARVRMRECCVFVDAVSCCCLSLLSTAAGRCAGLRRFSLAADEQQKTSVSGPKQTQKSSCLARMEQTNAERSRALTHITNEDHVLTCYYMRLPACISIRYVCILICVLVPLTKIEWRDPGPGLIGFFFCFVCCGCIAVHRVAQGHRSQVRSGGCMDHEAD